MYKALKETERIVDRIVDIIFVLILVVGLYYTYDSIFVFNRSSADSVSAYKPTKDNLLAYKDLSDDCVGWITIYETGVDYPIMQGSSNSEYLNKDPYGAYSLSGSIFLDSRNRPDFSDEYSLVYGHHMANGYMFGALDDFKNENFFKEHLKGELIADGKYHDIVVFAYADTDASEGIIFNPDREGDRLEWARKYSSIFNEPKTNRLVALSTCKSPTSTLRTILFVYIVN